MTLTYAALSNHGAWWIALAIGLVAALIVAGLLLVLVRTVADIRRSASTCSSVAGQVASNTANIPQLEATAPVLGLIVEEAVVQDGYMNALTDGFGGNMTTRCIILSVLLAVVIVAVLAAALIEIRADLEPRRRTWPRSPGRSPPSSPSTCARLSPRSRRSTRSST